MFYSSYKHRFF